MDDLERIRDKGVRVINEQLKVDGCTWIDNRCFEKVKEKKEVGDVRN